MLFVPSIGGISHAPEENTSDEHLVLGARALLAGVREVAAVLAG
jgi:acetylornithine deacetylase/succinyl-diaminopimelate desuccinylase-like protein